MFRRTVLYSSRCWEECCSTFSYFLLSVLNVCSPARLPSCCVTKSWRAIVLCLRWHSRILSHGGLCAELMLLFRFNLLHWFSPEVSSFRRQTAVFVLFTSERGSRGSAILPLPRFRLNSTCLSKWCSGSPVEGSRLWMSHSGYVGQGCSTADPGAAGWPLPKSGILCLCLVIGALCHPVESTFCVCAAGSEIHIHS